MAYRPWYERFPHRLAAERTAMHDRGFTLNEDAFNAEGIVEFKGTLANSWDATVLYPGSFPSKPPHLCTSTNAPFLPRHHRPDTREICTFGPNQARWNASMDGTSVIDEAETVISDVLATNPSDTVPEPASALYTYDPNYAVLIPVALPTMKPVPGEVRKGVFRLRKQTLAGTPQPPPWRGIILETTIDGKTTKTGPPYNAWLQPGQEVKGTLVILPTPPPFFATPRDLQDYFKMLRVTRGDLVAFVFPEHNGTMAGQRWTWLMVQSTGNFDHRLIRSFPVTAEDQQVRIPGLGALREKRVVIIGCGSIGSKLATSLAATGVHRFGLLDADYLEPFNAVRHEVGMHAFGVPKAFALAQHLVGQYGMQPEGVQFLLVHIGAQNTAQTERNLIDLLATADLVIDATGNHGASHFINDHCSEHQIPALYVSVTNGAWSGEIVRYQPGRSACWNCWLAQYEHQTPPASPNGEVFAPGCDQPTFTGTTYEVGMVANLAAKIAVDLLLHADPEFPHDYVVWHERDENGKPSLMTTQHPVAQRSPCPFCNP